jgi:hypothetical protein
MLILRRISNRRIIQLLKIKLRLSNYILLIVLLTTLSCDRLKRKGDQVINKTKEKAAKTKETIIKKKDELIDKVFPIYNSSKPDTDNNKKRFKEHLKIELTEDINNIYTHGDFLGIDYKVLISFNCDTATVSRIIKAKSMNLSLADHDNGLIFISEFPWWNEKVIEKIKPYKVGKEYEYWQYLWYDRKSKTAYYEEFSL